MTFLFGEGGQGIVNTSYKKHSSHDGNLGFSTKSEVVWPVSIAPPHFLKLQVASLKLENLNYSQINGFSNPIHLLGVRIHSVCLARTSY